jgi:serralysin
VAYGTIVIGGAAGDWTQADRLDAIGGAAPGFTLHGKVVGDAFVLAIEADATPIGAGTTFWFNTDLNTATGYQVWGWAVGAEFNINFNASGTPGLFTGAAGQTALAAALDWKQSADKTFFEAAIPLSQSGAALGFTPTQARVYVDVNDTTYIPTQYVDYAYKLAPPSIPSAGGKALDGALGDWTGAERLDSMSNGIAGYEVYGAINSDYVVFALKAPIAIGANTTVWLNTDLNASTGTLNWGWAGGAEFNINFDANGVPHLYTGEAGQNAVAGANVLYGVSSDGKTIEFAVAKASLGGVSALNALVDINDADFLPTAYAQTQYHVEAAQGLPPRTDFSKKVAIVYSDTTAKLYTGRSLDENMTAYSQIFMAAQSQAESAGIPFDILKESDLTNLAKLTQYDAIVFRR